MVSSPPPLVLRESYAPMWLIVFGPGPESEALADLIAQQCQQHGITVRKRAIDEYDSNELGRFPSLVVCLPALSSSTKVRQTLDPFAALVKDYRARWYRGLRDVRDSAVDILDVGVVQLLGATVALDNPAMRSAHRTACYVQAVDADAVIDALRPYRVGADPATRNTPWDDPVDVAAETVADALRYLGEWGKIDTTKIPVLLACIESCRNHFENPRMPALYRPISGTASNRLDFILDGGEPH